ncbi:hypothetical protein [Bowmanella sp. JS7-9]|uniref:Uncharacterized protein n=1 Tax=Pseudobowmanella zhangzhouensis TaxID=1537679 RepID=A0ABW1XQK7_9ALTE|nr:hypothetical protein [Bowmanella sp. JS7-9]TBX23628.1 hypothetical protein TK45_05805 [Bowmanella sp. JS7-9]
MTSASVLEHRLMRLCPNVIFYEPLNIDEKFIFILHRLLTTLSFLAGNGSVEVLYVEICKTTHIPTLHLMLPSCISNEVLNSLFDETQLLLNLAAVHDIS